MAWFGTAARGDCLMAQGNCLIIVNEKRFLYFRKVKKIRKLSVINKAKLSS